MLERCLLQVPFFVAKGGFCFGTGLWLDYAYEYRPA